VSDWQDMDERVEAALQIFRLETMQPDLVPAMRARLRGIGVEARVEILPCKGAGGLFVRVHTDDGQVIDFGEEGE